MATILCVADQPEDTSVLESTLTEAGHEVVVSTDRFLAIENLLSQEFGAVILCLGASGAMRELVPLICRLDRRVPVLTVAEEDSVETQREIRRSRVFYHLTQPVDADELRQAIREALARREAR